MEDYINDLLAKARELAIEGKLTEAKQLYRTIILDYPNSTKSNIAIEEMKKLDSLDFSVQNCSTNSIKPKKKSFPTLQVISLSILLFGLFFSMPLSIFISLLFNISDSDILALMIVIFLLVSAIASLVLAILSIVFKKPRKVFSIVLIVISTLCFIFDFFLLCTGITDIASPKDNNVALPTPKDFSVTLNQKVEFSNLLYFDIASIGWTDRVNAIYESDLAYDFIAEDGSTIFVAEGELGNYSNKELMLTKYITCSVFIDGKEYVGDVWFQNKYLELYIPSKTKGKTYMVISDIPEDKINSPNKEFVIYLSKDWGGSPSNDPNAIIYKMDIN